MKAIMANWQLDHNAVHRELGSSLPSSTIKHARSLLEQVLNATQPATPGWLIVGMHETNPIDLREDEDGCDELYCRIDARTDAESFGHQIAVLMP